MFRTWAVAVAALPLVGASAPARPVAEPAWKYIANDRAIVGVFQNLNDDPGPHEVSVSQARDTRPVIVFRCAPSGGYTIVMGTTTRRTDNPAGYAQAMTYLFDEPKIGLSAISDLDASKRRHIRFGSFPMLKVVSADSAAASGMVSMPYMLMAVPGRWNAHRSTNGLDDALKKLNCGASGPSPTAPKAPAPAAGPSWAGKYAGSFDGGSGNIVITGSSPNYTLSVDVVNRQGCSGGVSGPARPAAPGSLVMSTPVEDGSGMCRITMTRKGAGWTVEEDNCLYYHGAACSFYGTATKAK